MNKEITSLDIPLLLGEVVRIVGQDRWGRVRMAYFGDHPDAGTFEITFTDGTPEKLPFGAVASQFSDYPDNLARGPVPPRGA
ncbi:hypothetical protein [Streptomyces sp. NPDC001401]|uniref:hypothetical protein n=1 Tax=Streptomyces sp. NPDC001401 TaxID=3364570 RepID=UPI003683F19B